MEDLEEAGGGDQEDGGAPGREFTEDRLCSEDEVAFDPPVVSVGLAWDLESKLEVRAADEPRDGDCGVAMVNDVLDTVKDVNNADELCNLSVR